MSGPNIRACLLIYDIPERSDVANPSGRLRRMAVRVNLSCWVIPEADIPYHLLDTMRAGGATWHVVRFDAGEGGKLVQMAIEALRRDIREALARAREAAERAGQRLGAGDVRRFVAHGLDAVARLRRLLADFTAAASRFGITAGQLSMTDAHAAISAIHAGYTLRAKRYAEAAATVRQLGDDAMARAAEADQVPAGILADDIDDRGGDASALRAAFEERDE